MPLRMFEASEPSRPTHAMCIDGAIELFIPITVELAAAPAPLWPVS
jgi:hypothetical protein